jgi:hypothetical protein
LCDFGYGGFIQDQNRVLLSDKKKCKQKNEQKQTCCIKLNERKKNEQDILMNKKTQE